MKQNSQKRVVTVVIVCLFAFALFGRFFFNNSDREERQTRKNRRSKPAPKNPTKVKLKERAVGPGPISESSKPDKKAALKSDSRPSSSPVETGEKGPFFAIRGRVFKPDNWPAKKCEIVVSRLSLLDPKIKDGQTYFSYYDSTETGENGEFKINARVGQYEVVAKMEGFLNSDPQKITISKTDPTPMTFHLKAPFQLSVEVVDSTGSGVPNAEVTLMSHGPSARGFAIPNRENQNKASDSLGRAFFDKLLNTCATLIVAHPDWGYGGLTVDFAPDRELQHARVVLQRGTNFTGQVIFRKDKKPLSSSWLRLSRITAPKYTRRIETDKEGRFTTGPLSPGRYFVYYGRRNLKQLYFEFSSPQSVQKNIELSTIHLEELLPFKVTVIDLQGHPIEGAHVRVLNSVRASKIDRIKPTGTRFNREQYYRKFIDSKRMTDKSGHALFAGLEGGVVHITVTGVKNQLPIYLEDYSLTEPNQTVMITVSEQKGVIWSGIFYDENGQAVKSEELSLYRKDHYLKVGVHRTDRSGRFQIGPVPPGRYRLVRSVIPHGYSGVKQRTRLNHPDFEWVELGEGHTQQDVRSGD